MMQKEDTEVSRRQELLLDPLVAVAANGAMIEIGFRRIYTDDADAITVTDRLPRSAQLLDMTLTTIAGIVGACYK